MKNKSQIKYFFLFLFIFNINNYSTGNEIKIIASVNNFSITNIDINNEIQIIGILNNTNINYKDVYKIALNNLIKDKIKLNEIKKKNITFNNVEIENFYKIFLSNSNFNKQIIDEKFEKIIKEKIFIDRGWNDLINFIYGWKININIEEIKKKINDEYKTKLNQEKILDELINKEKEKKIKVYSKYHLNNLRKKAFIILHQ